VGCGWSLGQCSIPAVRLSQLPRTLKGTAFAFQTPNQSAHPGEAHFVSEFNNEGPRLDSWCPRWVCSWKITCADKMKPSRILH
jgi:hypothetical protein